jgi:pre-mRNA-processing factor 8
MPGMSSLYRLAGQVLSDLKYTNYFYLFGSNTLITAKILYRYMLGEPKFELMCRYEHDPANLGHGAFKSLLQ